MSEKNNRVSQYGVEKMFLDRWSSRSFSPKKIDQELINQLFEEFSMTLLNLAL